MMRPTTLLSHRVHGISRNFQRSQKCTYPLSYPLIPFLIPKGARRSQNEGSSSKSHPAARRHAAARRAAPRHLIRPEWMALLVSPLLSLFPAPPVVLIHTNSLTSPVSPFFDVSVAHFDRLMKFETHGHPHEHIENGKREVKAEYHDASGA